MSIYFNGNFIDTAVSVVSVEISSGGGATLPDLSAITNYPATVPGSNVKLLYDTTDVSTETSNLVFVNLSSIDQGNLFRLSSNYITSYSFPNYKTLNGSLDRLNFYQFCQNNKVVRRVSFPALSVITGSQVFDNAFYGSDISVVDFPQVTSIWSSNFYNAFYNSKVVSVNFDNLLIIGQDGLKYAFNNTDYLDGTINFDKVSSVGYQGLYCAFEYSNGIKSLKFPALSSLENAGYAFAGVCGSCSQLSSVEFPELRTLGDEGTFQGAFRYCYNLSSISFPKLSAITRYAFPEAFRNCSSLISADFSAVEVFYDVFSTFEDTFNNCVNLKIIDFSNLTSLSYYTQFKFLWNSNEFPTKTAELSIKFGNVQSIESQNTFGYYPWDGCDNLVDVLDFTGQQSVPTIGNDTFQGDTQLTAVVPDDLYSDWTSAQYWYDAIQNNYITLCSESDWSNR